MFALGYAGITALHLFLLSKLYLLHSVAPAGDNLAYHYPIFRLILSSINAHHNFPDWIPFISNGFPTIVLTNNFYLLNSPKLPFYFAAFFLNPNTSGLLLYKLSLFFTHVVLSFLVALLARELFNDRRITFFAYAVTSLSGLCVKGYSYEQVVASTLYLPLLLFLAIRGHRTQQWRYFCLFGLFLGHAFTQHYPHLPLYALTCTSVSLLIFYPSLVRGYPFRGKFWMAALITLLMSMIPLYCYWRYGTLLSSPARTGGLEETAETLLTPRGKWSLDPRSLITYLSPWYGLTAVKSAMPPLERSDLFTGTIAFLLAALGFVFGIRDRKRLPLFLAMSAALITLFAIGSYGFVYPFLYQLGSLFRLQRLAYHMDSYITFFLVLLACCGVKTILRYRFGSRIFWGLLAVQIADTSAVFHYLLTKTSNSLEPTFLQQASSHRLVVPALSAERPDDTIDWFRHAIAGPSELLGLRYSYHLTDARKVGSVDLCEYRHQQLDQFELDCSPRISPEWSWKMNSEPDWVILVDGHRRISTTPSTPYTRLTLSPGNHHIQLKYEPWTHLLLRWSHIAAIVIGWLVLAASLRSSFSPAGR